MRLRVTLIFLLLLTLSAPATALAEGGVASRVVVVLAPYLTWEDVESGHVPTIARLAEEGAVANVNVLGIEGTPRAQTLVRGALSLSAGNYARSDSGAPTAYSADERHRDQGVRDFYERTTGWKAGANRVLYLGMPRMLRMNSGPGVDIVPGVLGDAVARVGGVTAAIGNSDQGVGEDAVRHRPAAIVAMDRRGGTDLGDVSRRMLADDDDSPFGVRSDLRRIRYAYDRVLDTAGSRPALIVIDPGDSSRARAFADTAADGVVERQRLRALSAVDEVVAMAAEDLPDDALLAVVSPVLGPDGESTGFSPVVLYGRGYSGVLTSSSTHRLGLVTLPDVTATLLAEFGARPPAWAIGAPAVADRSWPEGEALSRLRRMETVVNAIEGAKLPLINSFIIGTVALVAVCAALLFRIQRLGSTRARRLVDASVLLMLFALAVPLAGTVMFALGGAPSSNGEAVVLLLLTAAGVWALLLLARRLWGGRVALASACLATTFALLVDQLVGAPASFGGFFSYSPFVGARYYGLGNEGASLLVASSLVGLALLFDEFAEDNWVSSARRYALPLLAGAIVVTAAAPGLGANVGVIAWGSAAFIVAWALMNGRALSWRTFALFGIVVVGLVGAFSLLDIGGPAATQTHLARALTGADEEGLGALWEIIRRKALLSSSIFSSTSWSYLLVAVLAFLAYVRWRPQGDFKRLFARNPYFAAAVAACLFGSATCLVSEDSGIVMPALILLYVGIGVLYLMLTDAASDA